MKSGKSLVHRAAPGLIPVAVLLAGLALASCSSGSTASSAVGAPHAGVQNAPAGAAGAGAAAPGSSRASSGASGRAGPGADGQVRLASSGDIVYTANLTVRVADVTAADAQAKNIVTAAGGYVSGESLSIDRSDPARSTGTLQLQVPAVPYSSYSGALDRLGGLGTRVSQAQQAQDITSDVADVSSRVASDQSAIAELRDLLGRASSVGDVLNIQEQINQQESDLESLQARQRALSHEVSYATVSLYLTTSPPAAKHPAHHSRGSGFAVGLSGGWHALRLVGAGLFTGFGAVLPFAVLLAAAGYLGYRGRRMLARRRARAAE